MESLPKWNLDLTSFSLKYSFKCALKSLKYCSLVRLADARQPNNMSAILFLRGVINLSQIYSLNRAIPPSKNLSYAFQELAPDI